MPRSFPNMDSLKFVAKVHKFREPKEGETEDEYRLSLSEHVKSIDFIESQEIKHKVGWDKWDDTQKMETLLSGFN